MSATKNIYNPVFTRYSRAMPLLKTILGLSTGPTPQWPMPDPQTVLKSERLTLRLGTPMDWQSWRSIRALSAPDITPWEPAWPPDALTYDFFCKNLRRQWREWRDGHCYSFLVLDDDRQGAQVIGGIALNDVHRGIGQKGTLGYWMGTPHTGQGLMTEAASLVMDFAFHTLKLHRIEASTMPANTASRRVLEKLGFTEEGLAHHYLRINGRWEDHILWGRVTPTAPAA